MNLPRLGVAALVFVEVVLGFERFAFLAGDFLLGDELFGFIAPGFRVVEGFAKSCVMVIRTPFLLCLFDYIFSGASTPNSCKPF